MNPNTAPMRVLVAGGGVAGMEAILALRELAGERVDITMLAPEGTFAYRPMAVAVPFARGHVQRLPLAEFARETSTRLVRGELAAVEPGIARTTAGAALPFDALLVAVGAWSEPAVPGATTWTPELDQEVMGGLLADIEEGYTKRVAFVVPEGAGWPLPAYELALMTAWDARDMGQDDVEVAVITPEPAPLAMFGDQASESLRSDLDEAGVIVRTRCAPARTSRAGARSRCPARRRGRSPGFRTTSAASSRSTPTGACPASRASGRRATARPSRSSRAAWPRSRPTRPPSRSPPAPARTSTRSRSTPCCAASCSPAAAAAGSAATSRRRATTARRSGARCGGRRRRSPARTCAVPGHARPRPPARRRAARRPARRVRRPRRRCVMSARVLIAGGGIGALAGALALREYAPPGSS